jgi:uncharacterized protein YbjT (DUF2867 family)
MYIILGGTGNIGSALSQYLLDAGKNVTVITHDKNKTGQIEKTGAKAAVASVMDSAALHKIFKTGKRLFLLNPPAHPNTDTAAEERKSLAAIFKALEGVSLERIVAESTYGAQEGENIGDLGVLYEMEEMLAAQPIPYNIIRGAYYYTNWDMQLESARSEGKVYSLLPEGFKLGMVAPADIARLAFDLITTDNPNKGPHFITGPEDYSPADVAAAYSTALGKPVEVVTTPESEWAASLEQVGFSHAAAQSMANMTKITIGGDYEVPGNPNRGAITLEQHICALVAALQTTNP